MKKIITNLEKGYITTPNGKFMFVNVSGQGKQNYKKNGYEYVAAIQLDGDEAKAFKKEVDAYIEDNKPKKGKLRTDHHPYPDTRRRTRSHRNRSRHCTARSP